jgi:hypothetical protein
MSEEQFENKYELMINQFERAKHPDTVSDEDICSFSGCMFETFGEELEYVLEMEKQNRVITIIEGEDDTCSGECEACECSPSMFYVSGYHIVNRIGYLITTEPITEEFEVKLDW